MTKTEQVLYYVRTIEEIVAGKTPTQQKYYLENTPQLLLELRKRGIQVLDKDVEIWVQAIVTFAHRNGFLPVIDNQVAPKVVGL